MADGTRTDANESKQTAPKVDPEAKTIARLKANELTELVFLDAHAARIDFVRAVMDNSSLKEVTLDISPLAIVVACAALKGHRSLRILNLSIDAYRTNDEELQPICAELGKRLYPVVSDPAPDSAPADSAYDWWEMGRRVCGAVEQLLCSLDASQITNLELNFAGLNASGNAPEWDSLWNRIAGRDGVRRCCLNLRALRVRLPHALDDSAIDMTTVCGAIGSVCDSLCKLNVFAYGDTERQPIADFEALLVAVMKCRLLEELWLPLFPWNVLKGGLPRRIVDDTSLRVLVLDVNSEVTIPGLADVLSHPNSRLQDLSMFWSGRPQPDLASVPLATPDWWLDEMTAVGRAPRLSELVTSELRGLKTFTALAESICASKTLTALVINHSFPDEPNALLPVATALRSSPVLTELTLYAPVSAALVREFAGALRVNSALSFLDFQPPDFDYSKDSDDDNDYDDDAAAAAAAAKTKAAPVIDTELMAAVQSFVDTLATANRTLCSLYGLPEWLSGLNVEWTKMVRRNGQVRCVSTHWLAESDSLSQVTAQIVATSEAWKSLVPAIAFARANRTHAFQYSIIPLIDAIVRLSDSPAPTPVAARRIDHFMNTKFARAHTDSAS